MQQIHSSGAAPTVGLRVETAALCVLHFSQCGLLETDLVPPPPSFLGAATEHVLQ